MALASKEANHDTMTAVIVADELGSATVLFVAASAVIADSETSEATATFVSETASVSATETGSTGFVASADIAEAVAADDMFAAKAAVDVLVVSGPPGQDAARGPKVVFGDGGRANSLGVGHVISVMLPYAGTIVGWHILADVACTCSIDVRRNGASIVGSSPPSLTADDAANSTGPLPWSAACAINDVIQFEITALSGAPKQISLTLRVE